MPIVPTATSIPNTLKRRLMEGKVSLGFGVNQLRGSAPAMFATASGYDWLFIDMEHGAMSVEDASRTCTAALRAGVTPVVRCCKTAMYEGSRVLDNGALGIVVPHIDTAAEAQEVADTFRYPPKGSRSLASSLPQFGYAQGEYLPTMNSLNEETLIIVMIETPEAVENADAIAAVDGIDVVLLGVADLSATLGVPGEPAHAKVRASFQTVSKACKKHKKLMGMGGVPASPAAKEYIDLGAHMIMAGVDVNYIKLGGGIL